MINAAAISGGIGRAGMEGPESKSMLEKSDFLQLLVTQLQYQDPLNPMESAEFTAQLAQFSSLEQLTNVNDNLSNIYSVQQAFHNAQAASFIGKEIRAVNSTIHFDGTGECELNFELDDQAGKVFVSVYDGHGYAVRRFELENLPAGDGGVTWDGKNDRGQKVPAGDYQYEVFAMGLNDQQVKAVPYTEGRVDGLSFTGGEAVFKVGETKIRMGSVVEVRDPL